MTYAEAVALHAEMEKLFEEACRNYNVASAAVKRSKSVKNRYLFSVAAEYHDLCARKMREAQERMERAATVERRKALVAPRVAQRAAQGALF